MVSLPAKFSSTLLSISELEASSPTTYQNDVRGHRNRHPSEEVCQVLVCLFNVEGFGIQSLARA